LLAEVEELKSQQEAIRSIISVVVYRKADGVGYRTGTTPKPELKNPSERARQGGCGWINIVPRNSQISSEKMYVPHYWKVIADQVESPPGSHGLAERVG